MEKTSIDNLVVLILDHNTFDIKPLAEIDSIEVDLDKETWKYRGKSENIGESRRITSRGMFSQPVAVYDMNKMDINYLNSIVSTATQLQREINSIRSWVDD